MLSEPEIIWKPLEGSQSLSLESRADHTLLHGTRGSSKSATQLMRFRSRVGLGYGPFYKGVIFDVGFKSLADIVAQSKKFFRLFGDGAKFLSSGSAYKWVWPTGEELMFRHAIKLDDYENFHGHEIPFLAFNELTKWPTCDLYDKLQSTNRSSFIPEENTPRLLDSRGVPMQSHSGRPLYNTLNRKPLPPLPLECFSTTNPSGVGKNWVKKRFITCTPPGEVLEMKFEVFDPRTQKDIIVIKTQVAIFSSYKENKYLDPSYIAELDRLTSNDENLRAAWLQGSWDHNAGGAIDDVWQHKVHVLPQFKIPEGWRVDRSFDWGSSHPFSVCWWAESNGEEVEVDGVTRCFPKGTIIQLDEWYGAKDFTGNVGLKMSANNIAKGIVMREDEIRKRVASPIKPGPADNQINDVREADVPTIATKMQDHGIKWTKSDKSAGSRIVGLQLLRDRLQAAIEQEGPAIYFMQNCEASIDTLPVLPRDKIKVDDVDTNSIDHVYDAVRYRCLAITKRAAMGSLNMR